MSIFSSEHLAPKTNQDLVQIITEGVYGDESTVPDEYQLSPVIGAEFGVTEAAKQTNDPTALAQAVRRCSQEFQDSHPDVARRLASYTLEQLIELTSNQPDQNTD